MELKELAKKASEVRSLYDKHNQEKHGSAWTRLQLAQGFVGDVGDLQKILMAKEGLREMENIDNKIEHELADCFWSVLVLADKYEVDLEVAFLKTMDELKGRLKN